MEIKILKIFIDTKKYFIKINLLKIIEASKLTPGINECVWELFSSFPGANSSGRESLAVWLEK